MTSDNDQTARTNESVEDLSATPDPFAGPEWPHERRFRERAAAAPGHHEVVADPEKGERVRTRVRVRRRKGLARLRPSRRSPNTKKKSPRRRVIAWGLGIIAVLVLLSVAWLLYSSLRVRSDLQAVRSGVHQMRAQLAAGNLAGARQTAQAIRSSAQSAHNFTAGPVWALTSDLPVVGEPFSTARALTSSVNLVANGAITPLIDAIGTFQPGTLRTPSGAFNLTAIEHLVPTVAKADGSLTAAISKLQHASGSTWLGSVNHARNELIDQLKPLSHDLVNLHRAAAVVPTVLGAHGPRTYMISFQNDAEARATGGIPGAFAIVRADRGQVSFTHFEPDDFLHNASAHDVGLGSNYTNLFPTAKEDYRDSNYSPNFPFAGQIWASMYQQKTGQRIDGALIIDPTALQYLLQVSGPVPLPDGQTLSAGNVVSLTEQQIYARYPLKSQITQRKNFLLDVARAISEKLLSPGIDSGRLLHAAATAAGQHRLLFWSKDPNVERELNTVPLGGVVPTTKQPYVALALDNDSQSKLDYYLHASLDWHRTGCGATRDVTVTVKITNDAPTNLPQYVVGNSFPPRTESLDTYLYGSIGGKFTSVKVAGQTPFHVSGTDLGHPVYDAYVDIPPNGIPVTIVFHLKEPAWKGPVVVREQPLINPMTVTVSDSHC